jgi:plastocyanin
MSVASRTAMHLSLPRLAIDPALLLWIRPMSKLLSLCVFTGCCLFHTALLSAASLTARVIDQQGKPLANAVLTLQGPAGKTPLVLKADMDQRNQDFVPKVLVVHSNTQVAFPNSDNIRHQVYSFSPAKRFELRLYGGTPSEPLLFDRPGLVVLGCNIHDWMLGYIYVTDDPWFAVSDVNGMVKFEQMPVGQYSATLWHPKAPDMQVADGGKFEMPAGGVSRDFTLSVDTAAVEEKSAAPASGGFGDAFHKAVHP